MPIKNVYSGLAGVICQMWFIFTTFNLVIAFEVLFIGLVVEVAAEAHDYFCPHAFSMD